MLPRLPRQRLPKRPDAGESATSAAASKDAVRYASETHAATSASGSSAFQHLLRLTPAAAAKTLENQRLLLQSRAPLAAQLDARWPQKAG
ncbi:hypothetical protein OFY05_22980 (plasmid) [Pseudocitrobacter faecalis]|nr:hypothetical protein OFY05_22980 [Pseudocitrobacter faecalis]